MDTTSNYAELAAELGVPAREARRLVAAELDVLDEYADFEAAIEAERNLFSDLADDVDDIPLHVAEMMAMDLDDLFGGDVDGGWG